MFKFYRALLSLLLTLLILGACQHKPPKESQGLNIVTSFYPIYAMVKEVSGELNDVRMIQSGQGIHEFEPSVADIRAIHDADVFIYHSHILESWAGRLDTNLKQSNVIVLEASKGMNLQRVSGLEDVPVNDGIDEATLYDPHTWVDPILVAEEVTLIAKQLAMIDPDHATTYQQNAEKMAENAEKMAEKFTQRFAKTKVKTFVTQHTAFAYLAKRFGLEQLGIATVTNQEPSPRQLAEIKEFIDTYQVTTIFVERGISDKIAKTLATSTKVNLKVLEPLEADPQNNLSYLDNLEANLTILAEELETRKD
ncbi:metal ABC transporter solute-binding protein, Zn/Mn family [Streptococcus sp. S784/96/1]|uniref:metal ABC transporter solute-binding protein, Zn/Mn family n=1 Tax=Streptococcus sp. S784/96/1 TaxID=2653499 RepID=UPI001386C877|nr:zinc ABC transporter substrate-binding protein [Streptococcus sp. S784/96/1]